MSADKHFNAPGHIPELLEDHGSDDMSAARSIGVILMLLLVVCSVIAAVIYSHHAPSPPVGGSETSALRYDN